MVSCSWFAPLETMGYELPQYGSACLCDDSKGMAVVSVKVRREGGVLGCILLCRRQSPGRSSHPILVFVEEVQMCRIARWLFYNLVIVHCAKLSRQLTALFQRVALRLSLLNSHLNSFNFSISLFNGNLIKPGRDKPPPPPPPSLRAASRMPSYHGDI